MFLVDEGKIIEGDFGFFGAHAALGALVALFRRAFEVDNLGLVDFGHRLEAAVERLENLVLGFTHIAQVLHQFREDVLVGEDAAFRDLDLLWVSLGGLMHLLHSSEDGVDLEGETPSFGLKVVLLQHVDVLSAEVLPFRHWFFDPSCLWHLLTQDVDDRGLAAADVALNCEVELALRQLRVQLGWTCHLFLVSR